MSAPSPSSPTRNSDSRGGPDSEQSRTRSNTPHAEARALAETADILRQVAHYDGGIDARRGVITASLASLVAAIGREHPDLSPGVATCAMAVVAAVDHATGHRRT